METRKRGVQAHMSPQSSTEMTYDDPNSPSLEATATQFMLEFGVTKGFTIHTLTHMTRQQLSEFLRDFYSKLKSRLEDQPIGMKDLREGLHRYFLREMAVDIVRDKTFELANTTFDIALRSNTSSRKCHRMRIDVEDLRKIYFGDAMDLTKPDSLQNKVFFDVNLYICNRSKDHLRLMKKDDFEVSTDVTGKRYVWLKEHPKFSTGTDKEFDGYQIGDRMMERPGDPKCPVRSFLKYVEHLHPMTDAFWQRPKRNVNQSDYVWYDHSPMGTSTLNRIMQRISIMAGMYESYTNHSIRASYIPLIESMCAEALSSGGGTHPLQSLPPDPRPVGEVHTPRGSTSSNSMLQSQDSRAEPDFSSGEDSSSVTSEQKDAEDDVADPKSLREAKMKVLEQIQNVTVRDIPKFVDWLKTVRVEYHGDREMRVLCNPVDKHIVDLSAHMSSPSSSERHHPPSILRQPSKSLDPLPHHPDMNNGTHSDFSQTISIKQVEFRSFGDTYCSLAELSPMKITIPTEDTLLVSGVPDNVQLMLHKKQGEAISTSKEAIADRIFYSENEMDVAEVAAHLGTFRSLQHQQQQQQQQQQLKEDVSAPLVVPSHHPLPTPIPTIEAPSRTVGVTTTTNHLTVPPHHRPPVQQQNSFETKSKSELIKTKKYKSVTYREPSPVPDLKRVSSTGTPILKRQANVVESPYGDDPLPKRAHSEDHGSSVYPHMRREESLEALRLRADRLDDSLRMHQEILQNSPLLKKQLDRHGTGFRHSYNPVKAEPGDS
ncbi:uncharacterized protein LOC143282682 isoform X2 [Babylonia areolata]|uniref:uncharacterized protein LOC143282682 isoform X2 n=1 Tax=Babylonia areolata TaxID=304850 RepID=UPI003FD4F54C